MVGGLAPQQEVIALDGPQTRCSLPRQNSILALSIHAICSFAALCGSTWTRAAPPCATNSAPSMSYRSRRQREPRRRGAVEIRDALLYDFTSGGYPAPPTYRLKISIASTRVSIIVDVNTSRPDVENY